METVHTIFDIKAYNTKYRSISKQANQRYDKSVGL